MADNIEKGIKEELHNMEKVEYNPHWTMAAMDVGRQGNFIDKTRSIAGNYIRVNSHYTRELMAEFVGTTLVIAMGEAGSATTVLSNGTAGNPVTSNLSWCMGVLFAIYMTKDISGGLFNPAIVVTWAFLGKLEWKKVIPYSLAEIAGGFVGAALVHALYYDAINAFDGPTRSIGPNGTAAIFATYPKDHLSLGGAVFDQVLATAVLIIAVLIALEPNSGIPADLMPIAVSLYVMTNGYMFTYNAGGGINPARDLGPRLWTAVAGWGPGVFSYWNYTWFWIPTFCPILGGLIGAVLYNIFIGVHWPRKGNNETSSSSDTLQKPVVNAAFERIYLSQQSIDFLESLARKDSQLALVR